MTKISKFITTITKKRSFTITPELFDKEFFVHNGNNTTFVRVNNNHLGSKLGMFALTKKLGKNIHNSERNNKRKNKNKNKKK